MINYVIVLSSVLETVREDMLNKGIKNVSSIQYLNDLFNPDGSGMLYTVVRENIWIISGKYTLICRVAEEKNTIKAVRIKESTTREYLSYLSNAESLSSGCTIITLNDANYIEKKPNDTFVQQVIKESEKNTFNKKEFKKFKEYWKTQDIASKLEKELIKTKKIESTTSFSSIQFKPDMTEITLYVSLGDFTYRIGDNIVISSSEEWNAKFQLNYSHMEDIKGIEIGKIQLIDRNKQRITITHNIKHTYKLLKQLSGIEEGYLWVNDIGSLAKKRNEENALKQLFNNQTANMSLKTFIPEVVNAQSSSFEMKQLDRGSFSSNFESLNDNQRLSVLGALNTEDIFLIQGPPGTGKTTVICEMIQYLAKQGNKILLSAQTHLAVDNVLQRIGENEEIDAIRIGNDEKVELGNEKYLLKQRVDNLQSMIVTKTVENKKQYQGIKKSYETRIQKLPYYEYVYKRVNTFMLVNRKLEKATKELKKISDETKESEEMKVIVADEIDCKKQRLTNNDNELIQIKKILAEGYSHDELINQFRFQTKVFVSRIEKEAIKEFKSCIFQLKNIKTEEINEMESLKQEKDNIHKSLEFYNQKLSFYKAEQQKNGVSYESQVTIYEKICTTYLNEYQEKKSQIEHFSSKSKQQNGKLNELTKKATKAKNVILMALELNKEPLNVIIGSEFNFKEFLNFYTQAQIFEWNYGKLPENTFDLLKDIVLFDEITDLKKNLEQIKRHCDELLKQKINATEIHTQINQLVQEHINNDHVRSYLISECKDFNQISTKDINICNAYIESLNKDKQFIEFYNLSSDIQEEWSSRMNVYQTSFEKAFIDTANLISATCVGINTKDNNYFLESEFDYLIIDEAGRASSLELLIPMIRAKKIILVGDHKQISQDVEKELMKKLMESEEIDREEIVTYKASLFGLMYENAQPSNKMFLNTQFRMSSDISKIVSDFYYNGELLDADNIRERSHGLESELEQSFYWIDTPDDMKIYQEDKEVSSPYNIGEVEGTINLLMWLDEKLNEEKTVGVIAPYKAQTKRLEKEINTVEFKHLEIEVNTIDAFQGREKQIIIMNLVRNNQRKELGFIVHDSRLNVAFSRAQELMFVIGNTNFIYQNKGKLSKLYDTIVHLRGNAAVKRIEEFARVRQDV